MQNLLHDPAVSNGPDKDTVVHITGIVKKKISKNKLAFLVNLPCSYLQLVKRTQCTTLVILKTMDPALKKKREKKEFNVYNLEPAVGR